MSAFRRWLYLCLLSVCGAFVIGLSGEFFNLRCPRVAANHHLRQGCQSTNLSLLFMANKASLPRWP